MIKSKKSSKIPLSSAQKVTITLALITFAGSVIVAYLQYFAPAKLAINSTQTAEVPTILDTKTIDDQASLMTASLGNEVWSSIIQVKTDPGDYCSIALKFPDGINPSIDPVKASEEVLRQFESGLMGTWFRVPAQGGTITSTLSGLPKNQSWVQIGNKAHVTISIDKDIPDHVNVIQDCGGGGEIRDFEPITLESNGNMKEYSLDVMYPDADFFTLQPAELEKFRFSFICKSPGAYRLNIEIPFEYENNNGLVQLLSQTLLCPKSFTK